MSLAETIYQHSLRLPVHAAQEALDFIEFLERRYTTTVSTVSTAQPSTTQKQAQASGRDANIQQIFGLVKASKHVSLEDMEQVIAAGKNRHVVD